MKRTDHGTCGILTVRTTVSFERATRVGAWLGSVSRHTQVGLGKGCASAGGGGYTGIALLQDSVVVLDPVSDGLSGVQWARTASPPNYAVQSVVWERRLGLIAR